MIRLLLSGAHVVDCIARCDAGLRLVAYNEFLLDFENVRNYIFFTILPYWRQISS